MRRQVYVTFALRRAIDWRNCAEAARASSVFGSTISIVCVFGGEAEMRTRRRSSTIIVDLEESMAKRALIHPGKILLHEFLNELGITSYALAKRVGVPTNRVTGIVNGDRSITADTALRFARFFGNSPEFWMNLQMHYDLEGAERRSGRRILRTIDSAPAL